MNTSTMAINPVTPEDEAEQEDPSLPSTLDLEIRQIALTESVRSFRPPIDSEDSDRDTAIIVARALSFEEFLLGQADIEDEVDDDDSEEDEEDDEEEFGDDQLGPDN